MHWNVFPAHVLSLHCMAEAPISTWIGTVSPASGAMGMHVLPASHTRLQMPSVQEPGHGGDMQSPPPPSKSHPPVELLEDDDVEVLEDDDVDVPADDDAEALADDDAEALAVEVALELLPAVPELVVVLPVPPPVPT